MVEESVLGARNPRLLKSSVGAFEVSFSPGGSCGVREKVPFLLAVLVTVRIMDGASFSVETVSCFNMHVCVPHYKDRLLSRKVRITKRVDCFFGGLEKIFGGDDG